MLCARLCLYSENYRNFYFFRSIGLGRFDTLHFISMVLRMEPVEHYPLCPVWLSYCCIAVSFTLGKIKILFVNYY